MRLSHWLVRCPAEAAVARNKRLREDVEENVDNGEDMAAVNTTRHHHQEGKFLVPIIVVTDIVLTSMRWRMSCWARELVIREEKKFR